MSPGPRRKSYQRSLSSGRVFVGVPSELKLPWVLQVWKSYQYVFPWKSWSNITYSQFPKVCWPWSLLLPLAFSTFFSLQASLFHIDAVLEHPEVGFQKKLQSMTVQLCMLPIDNAFTLIYNFQDYVLLKNFVDYKKPWFPSKATGCHAAQGASRWSGGERKTFVLPRMDGN